MLTLRKGQREALQTPAGPDGLQSVYNLGYNGFTVPDT